MILFGIFGVVYRILMDVVLRIYKVGMFILFGVLGLVVVLNLGGFDMWFVEFIVVIIYIYMVCGVIVRLLNFRLVLLYIWELLCVRR